MKSYLRLATLLLATLTTLASCDKDENSGSVSFEVPAVFIASEGGYATVNFTPHQVKDFTVTSKPKGWEDPIIDVDRRTVTITAPSKFEPAIDKSGKLTISGKSASGKSLSASVFVGVIPTIDLSTQSANSYVINKQDTHYLINATSKGESQGDLAPASVGIIWQTATNLVEYSKFENGKFSFYIGNSGTSTGSKLKPGNALIGAYDKAGKLLWSWHLWIADFDPQATVLAFSPTQQMMDRNLGALTNSNATNAEILSSFGLYYQWGRKEPFIGPADYKSSNGLSAALYSAENKRIYITFAASDAKKGNLEYASANPMVYITGVEASDYDWRWSDHTTPLWSDTKSVNDPCPRGWKVASTNSFNGLAITPDSQGWSADKYGCEIFLGGVKGLFMGAGRRIYGEGKFQNTYFPDAAPRSVRAEGQPWVGLNWTTSINLNNTSSAFYFRPGATMVDNNHSLRRANGISVRCVKAQ